MLLLPSSAVFAAALFLSSVWDASAQISEAVCPASYNWADNSLGQSPCVVGAYLLRQCSTSEIDIPALPAGDHYDPGDESTCNCNTVVYSLISACADCQNRLFDTWTAWSVNCTNVYRQTFPETIPSNTAVPAWAYLDVVSSNQYNATLAQADLNAPESTASTPGTPSTTISSGGFSTALTPPTPTSTSSSSHKTNVGAIAGGVVGGLVVIGLFAAFIVWMVMRTKKSGREDDYSEPKPTQLDGAVQPYQEPPYQQPPYQQPPYQSTPQPQAKLYDPSDPSTFPDATMTPPGMSPPPHMVTPPPAGYPQPMPPVMGYTPSPPPDHGMGYYGAPQV